MSKSIKTTFTKNEIGCMAVMASAASLQGQMLRALMENETNDQVCRLSLQQQLNISISMLASLLGEAYRIKDAEDNPLTNVNIDIIYHPDGTVDRIDTIIQHKNDVVPVEVKDGSSAK